MPEIKHTQLSAHLSDIAGDPVNPSFLPVYLFYGEEMLYKKAFGQLLDALLPAGQRSLQYEPIAGDQENVADTIEKINTYALLPGRRVVAVTDSRVFYARQSARDILEKAKDAFDRKDNEKAARYTLDLLGLLKRSYDDIDMDDPAGSLDLDPGETGDVSWLGQIIGQCRDNRLLIPDRRDKAGLLKQAIDKGFPPGHHLLITTDVADRRRGLFKSIQKTGMVVDCSVPKGDRRADRAAQDVVLDGQMKEILAAGKKKISNDACRALVEITGFDLRMFATNLEKMISYLGERETITVEDVTAVLQRTKKDPIYELTNAIVERNTDNALFFLKSLLGDNMHPLQILAAMTNQIRRLLIVKDFIRSEYGKVWRKGLSFDHFKKRVMPAVVEYDRAVVQYVQNWHRSNGDATGERKKRQKKPKTELQLAKNPNNPYPVYLALQRSERYRQDELIDAVYRLNDADLRLKSSPQAPYLVLERAILSICKRNREK